MAHDVFISYSTKDKPTADAVCARLEGGGIRCWVAPRDISPGQDWGEAIIDAIASARVMVLVFSSGANESQQIKREVERAVNKGVTVIPLRIEDVVPNRSLEYFISTPHWLDALTPPLQVHLDRLVTTLQQILRGAAVKPPQQPPGTTAAQPRRRIGALLSYGIALLLLVVGVSLTWLGLHPAAAPLMAPNPTPISNSMVTTPVSNSSGKQESVWQGKWSDPAHTTYDFKLFLTNDNGSIKGQFVWILKYAASSSGAAGLEVGSSAIEQVSGHYDPETGEIEITGRGVSDDKAIAMDSYRFKLSVDGKSFEGKSLGHEGTWKDTINGTLISGALSFGSAAVHSDPK